MSFPSALASLRLGDAVVLCGAGISIEAPSELPAGDELGLRVFDLTTGGESYPYAADPIARVRRAIGAGELRLEVLCDLLSREIDPLTVVSPFGLLRASPPNRLHLALALLSPAAILTTNQDLLLERAGAIVGQRVRPVHLHGRCDRPRSIVTTVAGYLQGLSPRSERLLSRLVQNRDLVVVGYSGRDLDVMSSLLRTTPRRVFWIEHRIHHRVSELPPELFAAERHFGSRWTRVATDTGNWLERLLSAQQRTELTTGLVRARSMQLDQHSVDGRDKRLERRFARLDALARQLAVGEILRHAGLQREAQVGYARLRQIRAGDPRATLAWGQARFELNQFDSAIDAFREVARDGAEPHLRAQAVLGEVEALRDVSRFDEARSALARLAPIAAAIADPEVKARMVAAGQCQLGGIARTDGHLADADRAYRAALREALSAGDVRTALESRTWHAEILLARGRYTDALRTSRETLNYAPFTNARWLTWAMFVHGEALCAAGELTEGLDVFRQTLDEFSRYGNPMGETWTLLAEASFRRTHDPVGAGHALEAAREAADRYGSPLAYARARLLWEQAELERARHDLRSCRRRLAAFRKHVTRSFPGGHTWLRAHGDALEAELDRDRGLLSAAASATRVRDAYLAIGADGAARRMAVSAWAARRTGKAAVREPRFARGWKREGYVLEIESVERAKQSLYVPLNVWFVP